MEAVGHRRQSVLRGCVHPISTVGYLLRLVQQAQAQASDFQRSYDLTPPQLSVLGAVVSAPGIDQRTVSELTSVDKSTVADVVSRLVDRRLLHASRNRSDGRRDNLRATRTAIAVIYDVTPQLIQRNDDFLASLPESEREPFLLALQSIAHVGRTEPPSHYTVPSPDGVRPRLDVTWGLGRPLRACLQRYGRLWGERITVATPVQWLAMSALEFDSGVSQRDLGEVISLDKASMTEMLGRLTARGLITKSRDPEDGRRRILQLTDRGREAVRDLAPEVEAVEAEFLRPLDPAQQAAFVSALTRLAADCRSAIALEQSGDPVAG
jgi:DNA-binding MarR family transcriptional regulator